MLAKWAVEPAAYDLSMYWYKNDFTYLLSLHLTTLLCVQYEYEKGKVLCKSVLQYLWGGCYIRVTFLLLEFSKFSVKMCKKKRK